ncbi:MAG: aminoacyl-tRNA hydrolase [bacterium]
MILLLGLGNPGTSYTWTPHNLGFRSLDRSARALHAPAFALSPRFAAETTSVRIGTKRILLAKPQTMMNASGVSVKKIMGFYKVAPKDLWVFHDDLDLPFGVIRHSFDSRAAGHRGVQSIIDALGTKAFHRIRIGIGRHPRLPAEAYVLRPMTAAQRREANDALATFIETLSMLLNVTPRVA